MPSIVSTNNFTKISLVIIEEILTNVLSNPLFMYLTNGLITVKFKICMLMGMRLLHILLHILMARDLMKSNGQMR